MPTCSLDVLSRLGRSVPPAVAERAARMTTAAPPAEPLESASVVLLREGSGGLETYLLLRHARMAFAASMVVFPGGGVDPVGVVLAPGALRLWAHWVTPELEPRRYDTVFYVAELPPGAVAGDLSGETDSAFWERPAAALAAAGRGELPLMPPTLSILLELADCADLAAVRAAARDRRVERVLPRLAATEEGWCFVYPAADRR